MSEDVVSIDAETMTAELAAPAPKVDLARVHAIGVMTDAAKQVETAAWFLRQVTDEDVDRSDPRHRDRLSEAISKFIQVMMKNKLVRASLPGAK